MLVAWLPNKPKLGLQTNADWLDFTQNPVAAGAYSLTHVNNPGIIVKSSVATLQKLFTSARNRLFTSSEYALPSVPVSVAAGRFISE